MKWLPDRKWWASGIAGVLAFFIILGLQQVGITLDTETALSIAGAAMLAVQYITPASVDDVLKRIDDWLKKIGGSTTDSVAEAKRKAEG